MNVTYNNCDIINTDAGGVCSYADGTLDKPIALVQLKPAALEEIAAEAGVTGTANELRKHPKVISVIKAKLDATAKEAKLPALMHAAAFLPVLEPWTAENGCLTATAKLVPKSVYKLHENELE